VVITIGWLVSLQKEAWKTRKLQVGFYPFLMPANKADPNQGLV
jgi:hypothetical protein